MRPRAIRLPKYLDDLVASQGEAVLCLTDTQYSDPRLPEEFLPLCRVAPSIRQWIMGYIYVEGEEHLGRHLEFPEACLQYECGHYKLPYVVGSNVQQNPLDWL